jgi:hypothetical protein
MTTYRLQVFRLIDGMHSPINDPVTFTADSDDAAEKRMHAYARDSVADDLLVHVYRDGETRSFASAEGLLR